MVITLSDGTEVTLRISARSQFDIQDATLLLRRQLEKELGVKAEELRDNPDLDPDKQAAAIRYARETTFVFVCSAVQSWTREEVPSLDAFLELPAEDFQLLVDTAQKLAQEASPLGQGSSGQTGPPSSSSGGSSKGRTRR